MLKTNHKSPLAVSYARSLLELAAEQKQAEAIEQELKSLEEIFHAVPSFLAFLSDPAISAVERHEVLNRTFNGKLSPLMMRFLGVLNERGRNRLLPGVIEAYGDLLDEMLGKIEVDVTVAQKLSPEQLEEVRTRVSAALKKEAVVHQYVDEKIIGGLVLRIGDKLIDGSVSHQLKALKQQLLLAKTH